jgi:integrase
MLINTRESERFRHVNEISGVWQYLAIQLDFCQFFGNTLATAMRKNSKKRRYIRAEWPKVQRVLIRGEVRFKVDGRPHKERLFFRDENDALVQADVWSRERQNQGIEALEFPTTMRVQAAEAARLLHPFGKTLLDAAKHYAAHLESETRKRNASTVEHCIAEWLQAKRPEANLKIISPRTIRELEGRAQLFKNAFKDKRISEFDEEAAKTFLDSLSVSQRTRQNIRTKLVQFLNFCRSKKWITENPAAAIKVKVPNSDVVILDPAQAKSLLKASLEYKECDSLVPYVAVSLFAGLRPGEAEQLHWEQIHFESDQIEVRGATSKGRETRFVKIEPTLRSWLDDHRRKKGPLVGANFRKHWEAVRRKAGYQFAGDDDGVPWPPDVMRHSFGSYWLATHADRPHLAELMGNSVQIIKKHYRKPPPPRVAGEFWALLPTKVQTRAA